MKVAIKFSKSTLDLLKDLFKEVANKKEKALKTANIISLIKAKGGSINDRTLRFLIGQIRKSDMMHPQFILSSVDDGYWLSDDENEMATFVEMQLYRISNQYENIQALHQRLRAGKSSNDVAHQITFDL